MRFLVTAGMYLANGALFRTIDTVVEENPLSFATSRIVTMTGALHWDRESRWPRNSVSLSEFRGWLEFTPALADTTAESYTSVKSVNQIGMFCFVSAGGDSCRADCGDGCARGGSRTDFSARTSCALAEPAR